MGSRTRGPHHCSGLSFHIKFAAFRVYVNLRGVSFLNINSIGPRIEQKDSARIRVWIARTHVFEKRMFHRVLFYLPPPRNDPPDAHGLNPNDTLEWRQGSTADRTHGSAAVIYERGVLVLAPDEAHCSEKGGVWDRRTNDRFGIVYPNLGQLDLRSSPDSKPALIVVHHEREHGTAHKAHAPSFPSVTHSIPLDIFILATTAAFRARGDGQAPLGCHQVRYRCMAKNTTPPSAFALRNLHLVRRRWLPAQERCRCKLASIAKLTG